MTSLLYPTLPGRTLPTMPRREPWQVPFDLHADDPDCRRVVDYLHRLAEVSPAALERIAAASTARWCSFWTVVNDTRCLVGHAADAYLDIRGLVRFADSEAALLSDTALAVAYDSLCGRHGRLGVVEAIQREARSLLFDLETALTDAEPQPEDVPEYLEARR